MSHLHLIAQRHRPDRRSDIIFLATAALLTAISIASLTSRVVGSVSERKWSVTVLESAIEVSR